MSCVMRWRYGDTWPVLAAVESTTTIEIGDLVYLDGGSVKPASAIVGIGGSGPATVAAAQEYFHDRFLGVAMQQSKEGEAGEIRVATSGVFEFACASATFELGDRVGVAVAGTALSDQRVNAVAGNAPNLAVGRVAKRRSSAAESVFVEIASTVMRDGPQAAA